MNFFTCRFSASGWCGKLLETMVRFLTSGRPASAVDSGQRPVLDADRSRRCRPSRRRTRPRPPQRVCEMQSSSGSYPASDCLAVPESMPEFSQNSGLLPTRSRRLLTTATRPAAGRLTWSTQALLQLWQLDPPCRGGSGSPRRRRRDVRASPRRIGVRESRTGSPGAVVFADALDLLRDAEAARLTWRPASAPQPAPRAWALMPASRRRCHPDVDAYPPRSASSSAASSLRLRGRRPSGPRPLEAACVSRFGTARKNQPSWAW